MNTQVKVNKLKSLRGLYGVRQSDLATYLKININRYSKCENFTSDFKLSEMLMIVEFFRRYNREITLNDIWGD